MRSLVATILLAALSVGWSHPDVPVAETTLRLEPGESQSFPIAVHYHRVVGRLATPPRTLDGLEVLVVDEATWHANGSHVAAEDASWSASGREARVLNHLVRCCDDVYADYRLIVRNRSAAPIDVAMRVWAVHDDFAVVVDRAEPGAFGVPFVVFGVLAGFATTLGTRGRRAHSSARTSGPGDTAPPGLQAVSGARGVRYLALHASVALAGIALLAALTMGIVGAVRYGGDPVTGLIAVLADLPLPGGPFGSRAALVMGVLLVLWCGAIGAWIRSAAARASAPVASIGLALGAVSLAGGFAMGLAYDAPTVPSVLGLVLGAPLMVVAGRMYAFAPSRPIGRA